MGYRLALELLVLNEFDSIDKKVDKLRERIKEEKKTKNKI